MKKATTLNDPEAIPDGVVELSPHVVFRHYPADTFKNARTPAEVRRTLEYIAEHPLEFGAEFIGKFIESQLGHFRVLGGPTQHKVVLFPEDKGNYEELYELRLLHSFYDEEVMPAPRLRFVGLQVKDFLHVQREQLCSHVRPFWDPDPLVIMPLGSRVAISYDILTEYRLNFGTSYDNCFEMRGIAYNLEKKVLELNMRGSKPPYFWPYPLPLSSETCPFDFTNPDNLSGHYRGTIVPEKEVLRISNEGPEALPLFFCQDISDQKARERIMELVRHS